MKDLKTGMMVFLALALFVVVVLVLGELGARSTYVIPFPKVVGLATDSPVHLNGVQVGRVESIRFAPDVSDSRIFVTINLDASVRNRINASTVADIKSLGVLGDKYIALETADYSLPPLPEGGEIAIKKSMNMQAMLEQGRSLLDDFGELTASMRELVEKARTGKGLVGTLISNPELGREMLESLSIVSRNLGEGKGFVGKLINDKAFCRDVTENIRGLGVELNRLLAAMNQGDGALGRLISDPEFGERFQNNLERTLAGLSVLGDNLSRTSDRSMLAVLLTDDQAGEDLKAVLSHLRSILEKIDSGQGSLGKLVNDPALYDDADTVFKGAQNSWATRKVIKHYRKQAEKVAKDPEGN